MPTAWPTRFRDADAEQLPFASASFDRVTCRFGIMFFPDIPKSLSEIRRVLDPKVLLLDEPTAGMGPEERWRMIDKVQELWETEKITVVFIEHDMDIVFKIAPEIIVLCYGRVLAAGTPDAICRNEAVIDAYLGTEHHAGAIA